MATKTEYEILRYFEFRQLPKEQQAVAQPFHQLAYDLAVELPFGEETQQALRDLLNARAAALRSASGA